MADSAISKFIKENFASKSGLIGTGLVAATTLSSTDGKLKGILKTLKELAMMRFTWAVGLSAALGGLGKIVKGLVRDTGSLQAALTKLSQMQQLTRTFTGLAGGIEAARKKVAELAKLAGGTGKAFSFEQWGRAAQGLQVFTRGAYASAKALEVIGDAAASTGNDLSSVSDAVGEAYDTLRNGQPFAATAEKLRQMGLISQQDANHLDQLSASGTDSNEVFNELTRTLEKHAGGMATLSDSLDGVTDRYNKAKQALAEGVGAPWTDEEVENTKNMADAFEAATPGAIRLSQFLANLTDGFSTLKSSAIKWIAESDTLSATFENGAKAIGLMAAALTLFGLTLIPAAITQLTGLIAALGTWVTGLGVATGAVSLLTGALRLMVVGGGILAAITAVVALSGAFINFSQASAKALKAVQDFAIGAMQATNNVLAHIKAVQTLAEKHEAVAEALENNRKAQEELNAAQADMGMSMGEDISDELSVMAGGGRDILKSKRQRLANAKRNAANAQAALGKAQGISTSSLSPGEAGKRYLDIQTGSQARLEDATFGQQMQSLHGSDKISAMEARLEVLKDRISQAKRGLQAATDSEMGRGPGQPGTSTYSLYMASQATSGKARAYWEAQARSQQANEQSYAGTLGEAGDLNQQLTAEKRSTFLSMFGARSEARKQSAALRGDAAGLNRISNQETFLSKFEELRQFMPEAQARAAAMQFSQNSIRLNAADTALSASQSAAVSSLQRIGAGGNVGPGAGDPLLEVNRQIKDLQADAVALLKEINKNVGGDGVIKEG